MKFSIDDVICFYWWFYRDPFIVCQYPSMRLRTDAMLRTWHHITKFSDEEMPKVSYLWKSYTALYFLHFMLIYTVLVSVSWSMEAFLSGLDKKLAFTFKQGQRSVWPSLSVFVWTWTFVTNVKLLLYKMLHSVCLTQFSYMVLPGRCFTDVKSVP